MAQGIATRSSRGHRTICLPIKEEDYLRIVNEVPDSRNALPFLFPGICNPTDLESTNCAVLIVIRWPATPRLGASTGPGSSQEFGVRFSRPS